VIRVYDAAGNVVDPWRWPLIIEKRVAVAFPRVPNAVDKPLTKSVMARPASVAAQAL
jgi:hypothetical protein